MCYNSDRLKLVCSNKTVETPIISYTDEEEIEPPDSLLRIIERNEKEIVPLQDSLVGNSRTYQEEVEKVNLGEDGEIKEVKIGTSF